MRSEGKAVLPEVMILAFFPLDQGSVEERSPSFGANELRANRLPGEKTAAHLAHYAIADK